MGVREGGGEVLEYEATGHVDVVEDEHRSGTTVVDPEVGDEAADDGGVVELEVDRPDVLGQIGALVGHGRVDDDPGPCGEDQQGEEARRQPARGLGLGRCLQAHYLIITM
jgi:hypothetical protein